MLFSINKVKIGLFAALFLCSFMDFSPGFAACTDPDGVTGQILYNQNYDVFQGCTTEGWEAFHTPGPYTPAPPEGCETIGTACTGTHAGMIYAGDYGGYKLYVTPADAPTELAWGLYGGLSVGMEHCRDPYPQATCGAGLTNTRTLVDHEQTFPAAEYCANLSAYGYAAGQWYLPSLHELGVIYQNLRQGKPAAMYNFESVDYWSSSPYNNGDMSYRSRFESSYSIYISARSLEYGVRCMIRL